MSLLLKSQIFSNGLWVVTGQLGSAFGVLVGMRALTEYLSPANFGAVALYLGAVALLLGSLVNPLMQATLRYYPKYSEANLSFFKGVVRALLLGRFRFMLFCALFISPILILNFEIDWKIVLLCIILLCLDGVRSSELVQLNAARKQKAYALLTVSEAWGRPLAAVLALHFLGEKIVVVLMAYTLASALILAVYFYVSAGKAISDPCDASFKSADLKKEINKYALPLIPMAALGWLNGMGDRYLIGGLLGLEEAGIYAAVYGLMSRPFLMASGVVELTLRPLYNQFVMQQQHAKARKLLWKWFSVVVLVVGSGFLLIWIFDDLIIGLLLAEKYQSGVQLMVWIAAGYIFLAISDVFIKVCYAYGYTKRILAVQIIGAFLSLGFAVVGIKLYGLLGAAIAVPAYYSIMLVLTILFSRVDEISLKPGTSPAMAPAKEHG